MSAAPHKCEVLCFAAPVGVASSKYEVFLFPSVGAKVLLGPVGDPSRSAKVSILLPPMGAASLKHEVLLFCSLLWMPLP